MHPTVSIIIPCLNEEKRIKFLLDALIIQTYPKDRMNITIADGFSTDGTREIIKNFQEKNPELKISVIDNTVGTIPAGLNFAINNSKGEIILRLDAHSAPYPDYVERSVQCLEDNKGDNVGGIWEIKPGADTIFGRSIAAAASHPLGVGDAYYRHASSSSLVDTVPFGCYRRKLVETVGLYDETLLANEDYEFNARIRKYSGKIWLDSAIRSIYYSRPDLLSLAQQYFRYGFWKYKMLQRYPKTLRWRQALPPLFVSGLVLTFLLVLINSSFGWLLLFEVISYFSLLLAGSILSAVHKNDYFMLLGVPLSIACMHFSWGSGFLVSLFSDLWKK
ncbi:MAG: glycosyltransferase family 2 protein [Chloroflexota bacterium]